MRVKIMQENPFELISRDPVKFNIWSLKSKLLMVLIDLIEQEGWTQRVAAERLGVSQPRISNMFQGKLDKFSVDSLLEMLVSFGYRLDLNYRPNDLEEPLKLKLKKAMV